MMVEIRLPVGVCRHKSCGKYSYWLFRLRGKEGEDLVRFFHADYDKVIAFAEKWWMENRGHVEYRE